VDYAGRRPGYPHYIGISCISKYQIVNECV
jgi:hypothetical protein